MQRGILYLCHVILRDLMNSGPMAYAGFTEFVTAESVGVGREEVYQQVRTSGSVYNERTDADQNDS